MMAFDKELYLLLSPLILGLLILVYGRIQLRRLRARNAAYQVRQVDRWEAGE
ncbi:hypothetical protein [Tardiphaga alba]|uniref:hypothetical protein n=1 Tax=Tardiphaga alba TaxID=340268 RepID=UPI001BA809DF|nr:hypothetical protein [Tardiphaga alba]